MDQDEAMFGSEVKITDPKPKKSKNSINLSKWFALGLGGIFGLSHIGLIGMVSRKSSANYKSTSRTVYIVRNTI